MLSFLCGSREWAAAATTCRRWAAARLPSAVPTVEVNTTARAACMLSLWIATGYGLPVSDPGSATVPLSGALRIRYEHDKVAPTEQIVVLSPDTKRIARQVDVYISAAGDGAKPDSPSRLLPTHQVGSMPCLQVLRISLFHKPVRSWFFDLAATLRTAWTARPPMQLHTLWLDTRHIQGWVPEWNALLPLLPQLRVLTMTHLVMPLCIRTLQQLETLVVLEPHLDAVQDQCLLLATARKLSVHGALRTLRLASDDKSPRILPDAWALLAADRWPSGLECDFPLFDLPPAQLTDLQMPSVASDASLHAVMRMTNLRRLVYPLSTREDGSSESSLAGFLAETEEEIGAARARSEAQERALAEAARERYSQEQRALKEFGDRPTHWNYLPCDGCRKTFRFDQATMYWCTTCTFYHLCESCVTSRPAASNLNAAPWPISHDPRHTFQRGLWGEQHRRQMADQLGEQAELSVYPGAAREENWASRMVARPTAAQAKEALARLEELTLGGRYQSRRDLFRTPESLSHLQTLLTACTSLRVLQLHALHSGWDCDENARVTVLEVLCDSVSDSLEELVLDHIATPCGARSWAVLSRLSQLRKLYVRLAAKHHPSMSWLVPLASLPHFQHLTIDISLKTMPPKLAWQDPAWLHALAHSPAWCSGTLRMLYDHQELVIDPFVLSRMLYLNQTPLVLLPDFTTEGLTMVDSAHPLVPIPKPAADELFERLHSFRLVLAVRTDKREGGDSPFAVRRSGTAGEWRWAEVTNTRKRGWTDLK